jgi:hypothetical protein
MKNILIAACLISHLFFTNDLKAYSQTHRRTIKNKSTNLTNAKNVNTKLTPMNKQNKQIIEESGGIAFTCPAAKWSGKTADFYYHFTLAHITTQNPKVAKIVRQAIEEYINTHVPLTQGHHSLTWNHPGKPANSSIFLSGQVADFKLKLHKHLMNIPTIKPHISPYIAPHVDVQGDFSTKLYETFTADQIIERPTL